MVYLELAAAAGMRAALVRTGYGAAARQEALRLAAVTAPGVLRAVRAILARA